MAEKEDLLDKAKRLFKLACESSETQRDRENEDLRFQVPELQWDQVARASRAGGIPPGSPNGTPPVPARPILSIPKLHQPIQLVLNQERQAQLGVNIHPVSPDANDDVAEVLQGIYRSIERDSHARLIRSRAFERAVKAGRGAYRVNTRKDEESKFPFDQVITIEGILYQENVYFDPSAQKPDYSDGDWAFVCAWMSKEEFQRKYPKATASQDGFSNFSNPNTADPNWVRGQGETQAFLVAEYWYKEHQDVTYCLLQNGQVGVKGEYPDEMIALDDDGEKIETVVDEVEVYCAKICQDEVLEKPQEWNGKYIPLIPTIGSELIPIDGQRWWVGIIGPNKDAQRTFNYAASTAVEMAALEPKAPWIMAEGQEEGFESMWAQSNTRNFPYLLYKPKTVDGTMAPPPARVQVDVARMGASMQLLQMSDGLLQAGTAMFDPSLGRSTGTERSGKAIVANQQQGEQANSHFIANLADVSIAYEAKVILDLIPTIYDRPGRLAQVLDENGEAEQVILNQPFFRHPKTDRPVPAPPQGPPPMQPGNGAPPPPGMPPGPPGMPAGQMAMAPPPQRPKVMEYDLRKGTYGVTINVGKSYQSRLEAGAEEIGEILTQRPELMPVLGPEYFGYRDFPGAHELKDLLLKVRRHQMPWLEDDDAMTPEAAMAQNEQLKQQNQQLQQQVQGMQQALQTEQAKQQATLQKAQMDNAAKVSIAQINQETQLAKASQDGQSEQAKILLDHAAQQSKARSEVQTEVAKAAIQAQTDLAKADLNARAGNVGKLTGERDQY